VAETSLAERLQVVEALRAAETRRAVPELARLERQATGWGCILAIGGLGFGALAAVLLVLASALSWWLALALQLVIAPLAQLVPQGERFWLAAILLASALLIFFSPRWRSLMRDPGLWRQTHSYDAVGVAHLAAATLSRAGMTLLAGSFLPFTLLAPAFLILHRRTLWDVAEAWLTGVLPPDWGFFVPWVPYGLLILAPFVFFDWKHRTLRKNAVGLTFVLGGFLALVWLSDEFDWSGFYRLPVDELWPMSAVAGGEANSLLGMLFVFGAGLLWAGLVDLTRFSPPVGAIVLFLFLGAAYPLGLSFWLARIFYLPYAIFRNTLGFIRNRARLRLNTAGALNGQLRQNDLRVNSDGWGTVCSMHRWRFEELREPRSYFRAAVYYLCPVCGSDTEIYHHVACVSVLLDTAMTDEVCLHGRTLYLNGLRWPDEGTPEKQPPFESLVIGQADHFDVEHFLIHCHNTSHLRRSLETSPCYILEGQQLGEDTLEMLRDSTARIYNGFVLADETIPCRPSLRRKEAWKTYAQHR
jgi:hypothetical protein